MRCPECKGKSGIYDSRDRDATNNRKRFYKCQKCGYKFKTVESLIIAGRLESPKIGMSQQELIKSISKKSLDTVELETQKALRNSRVEEDLIAFRNKMLKGFMDLHTKIILD